MSAKQLAIIDYGMGNLHSVASAVRCVAPAVEVQITSDPELVSAADHVIFPGVGAIRDCMAEIRNRGADKLVNEAVAASKPLLGICVGMQALMERSEENGGVDCLGLMRGQVKRFPSREKLLAMGADSADLDSIGFDPIDFSPMDFKVPHMGWNQVEQCIDHPMWHNIKQNSRFYFVHSYYIEPMNKIEPANEHKKVEQQVAGRCYYGVEFCAAMTLGSVFAVQFHPEKSHTDGLQLLKNFIGWDGRP